MDLTNWQKDRTSHIKYIASTGELYDNVDKATKKNFIILTQINTRTLIVIFLYLRKLKWIHYL